MDLNFQFFLNNEFAFIYEVTDRNSWVLCVSVVYSRSSGLLVYLMHLLISMLPQPLADAYGLLMHRNGQWEWTLAPGVSPSPRYQHAAVSDNI